MITNIITNILQQFYKKQINYAILRNYDNFNFEKNKDIDLIIDFEKTNEVIKIILELLKKENITYQIERHLRITRVYLKISPNRMFAIDLNKYITLKSNILERKIPYLGTKLTIENLKTITVGVNGNAFNILDKTYELLLLTNHCLAKPKEKYILKLKKGLAEFKQEDLIVGNIDLNKTLNFLMNEVNISKQPLVNQLFKFPKFIYNYFSEK